MNEQWRPIPGFPLHMVSSEGRVFSWHSERFLRPGLGSHGYWKLNLAFGKSRLLHIVVAEAFLGPRPRGHVVRHRDGDRKNPRRGNLTYAENSQDAIKHGTHSGLSPAARAKAWETRKARLCAM